MYLFYTLFTNIEVCALNEMFQQNASKFAIFHVYQGFHLVRI